MKSYPFLDLKPVNEPYEQALIEAVADVIKSGRYINGQNVTNLETAIASICQAKHAIAVSNGLDALRLIIRAYKELGIFKDGDKIIVPTNTYIASVLAITDNNLDPTFIEPSELTFNLDSSQLEKVITPKTVAIMPVHLYGSPAWDTTLVEVATRYNLKIIEDNAQALGATTEIKGLSKSKHTGGLGDAAGISFYPTKNLGALGDAGMVTTNDCELAETVRAIANYGAKERYNNIYQGLNCRMDEIQAAILLAKLPFLESENTRRRSIVATYNNVIDNSSIITPHIFSDCIQVWHQYVLRVKNRDKFIQYMNNNGVATDVLYPTPIHKIPCYSKYQDLELPIAEQLSKEIVSLPIGAHISIDDAKSIGLIVNNFTA